MVVDEGRANLVGQNQRSIILQPTNQNIQRPGHEASDIFNLVEGVVIAENKRRRSNNASEKASDTSKENLNEVAKAIRSKNGLRYVKVGTVVDWAVHAQFKS